MAACFATGYLEMGFVCSSVRWEAEHSPLGSTMPCTCTAKAALKQSCYLPFSLVMPFLQGLFCVALLSHAEQSVGRALQGQVETFPEEREIGDCIVTGFLLSHHKHNLSNSHCGGVLLLCLDFRCKESGRCFHLSDCCAWPCPLTFLLQASPWN